MKKARILIPTAVLAAAAIGTAVWLYQGEMGTRPSGPVIATVSGVKIYKSDIDAQTKIQQQRNPNFSYDQLPEETKTTLLKNIYLNKFLVQKAQESNLSKDPEVKAEITSFRDIALKQAYLRKFGNEQVKEEAIKSEYDTIAKRVAEQQEYKIKHIVVKDRSEADAIEQELASTPFEEVAKAKSLDKASAEKGGEIGYVAESFLPKELQQALSGASVGKTTAPVHSPFGWHILKVEDKRPVKPMPYEQAKPKLLNLLGEKAAQAYVNTLLNDAKVNFAESTKNADAKSEPAKDKKASEDKQG